MVERRTLLPTVAVAAIFVLPFFAVPNLLAQSHQETGPTFYEEYRGSISDLGQITTLDLSAGYNFNRYFGADVGIPLHFVHRELQNSFPFLGAPGGWNDGFGNAYLNLRFDGPNRFVDYSAQVRTFAPIGSFDRGFNTGRVTVDWNNHFERAVGPVTPFADISLGNTLADRHYLVRPFSTLGLVSQIEGGASVKVAPKAFVGGSWYHVLPSGTQKIYSQLVTRSDGFVPIPVTNSRFFEGAFRTVGPSSILKDNGFSGWVGVRPMRNMDFELGYSRSLQYALDTLSFRVGFNGGSLFKQVMNHF